MARRTAWVDTLVDVDLASAGTSLVSLLGTLTPINTRATTVVRVLVDIVGVATTETTQGIQRLSIGIGVASQDAFTVGFTAIPSPSTAADEPPRGWVYRASGLVLVGGDLQQQSLVRHTADIRAKRKVDNGELYLVMTNVALFGTTSPLTIVGLVRTLLLLP